MTRIVFFTAIFMLLLDFIWLSYIAKPLYIRDLGKFFNLENGVLQINYIAAGFVYFALLAGIFFFVLPNSSSSLNALMRGAVFGLITYGIYDFTNLATIKDWPIKISLIDMIWGGSLCASTNLVAYILKNKHIF